MNTFKGDGSTQRTHLSKFLAKNALSLTLATIKKTTVLLLSLTLATIK